jgi:hypothetical protein
MNEPILEKSGLIVWDRLGTTATAPTHTSPVMSEYLDHVLRPLVAPESGGESGCLFHLALHIGRLGRFLKAAPIGRLV